MEPVLLQPGIGERIQDDGEVETTLLADLEEIGVDSVRSAPGRDAPPAHVHPGHSQCFLVLEGELTFRLENRELRAGPDTWVFVPPDVVHTFVVTGDEPAHFLDFHVPSRGLGDFVRGLAAARDEDELRAVRAAFDQAPPPEYASGDPGLVVLRQAGAGTGVGSTEPAKSAGAGSAGAGARNGERITDRPGRRITLLLDSDELAVTETVYGSGERGPDSHVHNHHTDGFVVLEGELTFFLESGSLRAPPGTFVLVPSDVVHTFANEGEASARFFNLHAPSLGFGDYLRGRKPDFDQHPAPAGGGNDPAAVIAVRLSG
jgi:quercetin dioxygenase-like cupin family protein